MFDFNRMSDEHLHTLRGELTRTRGNPLEAIAAVLVMGVKLQVDAELDRRHGQGQVPQGQPPKK